MPHFRKSFFAAVFIMGWGAGLQADERMFEDFESEPAKRWDFVADTVMGGVSTGRVDFEQEQGVSFARLTGAVSTENNGGFIQFRRQFDAPLSDAVVGVRLVLRGNSEIYFIHLRTTGTILPWQYYQAEFTSTEGWSEIRLPLTSFEPSGRLLRKTPTARSISSIGVVAFGRDHSAQIDVQEIDFY